MFVDFVFMNFLPFFLDTMTWARFTALLDFRIEERVFMAVAFFVLSLSLQSEAFDAGLPSEELSI